MQFSPKRKLDQPASQRVDLEILESSQAKEKIVSNVLKATAIALAAMMIFPPFRFVGPNGYEINLGFSCIFFPPYKGSTLGSINIPQLLTQAGFVVVIAFCVVGWKLLSSKRQMET